MASHLEQCETCQAELEAIRSTIGAFTQKLPQQLARFDESLLREAADVRVSAQRRQLRRSRWPLAVLSTVVAVAAMALLLVGVFPESPPESPEGLQSPTSPTSSVLSKGHTIRYRGTLAWKLIVKRKDEQLVLRDGAVAFPGDALRISLTTDRAGYISIVALDEHHQLTSLYPGSAASENPQPMHIASQGSHLLPDSVILDDEPGERHFVLVFAEKSFDRNLLHRGLARLAQKNQLPELEAAKLDLGSPSQVKRISIKKVVTLK